MRRFLTAWNFLTIVPFLPPKELTSGDIAKGMAFFPAVGMALGLVLAVSWALLSPLLPVGVVAVLVITLLVVITGALHVDGFADTLDGLAVMGDRERRLAVMKDSRIGAVGAIGLLLLFLLKIEAIRALSSDVMAALFLMPAFGRWAMVMVSWRSVYPRSEGTGRASVESLGPIEVITATCITLVPAAFILGAGFVAPVLMVLAGVAIIRWLAHRCFGGVTGDVIGTANECCEALFLVGVLL